MRNKPDGFSIAVCRAFNRGLFNARLETFHKLASIKTMKGLQQFQTRLKARLLKEALDEERMIAHITKRTLEEVLDV